MNKLVAVVIYLALLAAVVALVTWGMVGAGYSIWLALFVGYLVFRFLIGSLAYLAKARLLKTQGKAPPAYFRYIFLPVGAPRLKETAPQFLHVVVSLAAALMGAVFAYFGVALAITADWPDIQAPIFVALMCLALVALGASLFYLAWRVLVGGRRKVVAT
jgi:hypothetical protein